MKKLSTVSTITERITDMTGSVLKISESRTGDVLFYIIFGIIFFYRFYWTTMFGENLFDIRLIKYPALTAYGLIFILALIKIVSFFPNKWKEGLFCGVVILICALCYIKTKEREPIVIASLLIAGIRRNLKPVFFISLITGSIVLLAAYYASMNGYIPYLVYDRGGEMLSHAFGMIYRTDLAAHVLYLVMLYAILRGEHLHLWEYMMLWFDTFIIWRYTAARMNTLCLVLFLAGVAFLRVFWLVKKRWPVIPKWTAAIHILCFIGTMVIIILLPSKSDSIQISDLNASSIMSRITLSREGFEKYPINLFGHLVEERGAGGIPNTSKPYFYLDVMYVRILIKYGILVILLYLTIMTAASIRAAAENQAMLALSLIIVALVSVIEHHAMDIAYNVLILAGTGTFMAQTSNPLQRSQSI